MAVMHWHAQMGFPKCFVRRAGINSYRKILKLAAPRCNIRKAFSQLRIMKFKQQLKDEKFCTREQIHYTTMSIKNRYNTKNIKNIRCFIWPRKTHSYKRQLFHLSLFGICVSHLKLSCFMIKQITMSKAIL